MRIYTTHLKPGAAPVLVREGFSFWAAILGWIWLLWQRAWVPAALAFALMVVLARGSSPFGGAFLIGLLLLQGCFGRDLVRWSLAMRGYTEGPVVAARDQESAFLRLLTERADLYPDLRSPLDRSPA